MVRVVIPLNEARADKVGRWANREYRDWRMQVRLLLEQAIDALPVEPAPATTDRPADPAAAVTATK